MISRTLRTRRGAAMVEAVAVLPVLGILLVAIPWLHELRVAQQGALAAARHCGFAHALSGCTAVPAECQSPPEGRAAPDVDPENDVVAIARDAAGASSDVFEELPVLGDALATLLGDTFESRATVAIVPQYGVQRRVAGVIALVCNERPRDVLGIARDIFCRHLPLLDCGGGR